MKKEKIAKILSSIVLLALLILVHYVEPTTHDENQKAYESLRFVKFYGVVHEKYFDCENSNQPTIILENEFGKQSVLFSCDRSGFFKYTKTRDSISKEYGKYEVKLNRNGRDTVFILCY